LRVQASGRIAQRSILNHLRAATLLAARGQGREIPRSRMPLATGKRFEQRVAELFELASRPDLHLTGTAARNDLKVGELHLERDRAAANVSALAVAPYLVDYVSKRVPAPLRK
jgi:hypothetical protein